MQLRNDHLVVDVDAGADGLPRLQRCGHPGGIFALEAPVLAEPVGRGPAPAATAPFWSLPAPSLPGAKTALTVAAGDSLFQRGAASLDLEGGLRLAWTVELSHGAPLLRLRAHLTNTADRPRPVERFPLWAQSWACARPPRLRGWEALTFRPRDLELGPGTHLDCGSRLHSSDSIEGGVNPYWSVDTGAGWIYLALEWCGGWRARFEGTEGGLSFGIHLPPEETQLVLAPGESVDGPALHLTFLPPGNEMEARRVWMGYRAALARALYPAPEPSFPFSYNHWYSVRFAVDQAFLRRQVDAAPAFGLDAFVVDAGWYRHVGAWEPHPDKFAPGAFEALLAEVAERGMQPGIWSCPQFVHVDGDELPAEVDEPPFYRRFIDGHLLDLAGSDFPGRQLAHVAQLRERYHADWWKYDQDLFVERTRAGALRNVAAFQQALEAVRRAHPDLYVENCQSGGRMLNELVLLLCQSHWLADGGGSGIEHARDNVRRALGALELVFPWGCGRWTNRISEMDAGDEELIRYYCRSAMLGTWGLVDDLAGLTAPARRLIRREVAHYRRLNALKPACRYALLPATEGAAVAGATFYDAAGTRAGALLFRWDAGGDLEVDVDLAGLSAPEGCRVEDVDTGEQWGLTAAPAGRPNLRVRLPAERRSALVFVEAAAVPRRLG